jgi:membrane associated rhomboid family serine protease
MFPVGDNDAPGGRIPVITWLLIAVNALVFFYEMSLPPNALQQFITTWGVVPRDITRALSNPAAPRAMQELSTLITSQFLHGGWMHLIGNMLFLYIFGNNIEDLLGSILYLVFYIVCGIVAGLVQTFVLSQFTGDASVPGIGASGAIAGVLGAYLLAFPRKTVTVLMPTGRGGAVPTAVSAFVMLGFWFLQQLLSGVVGLMPGAEASNVGFWAHIGGFVAGALFILPFRGRANTIESGRRVQRRMYNPR